ncbi:hypothetical protein Anapl_01178 [Anas platyrhynchos]|uniref:Uncharacterized protein n=1 Tax=Anas platyrhynchos TaxID=8839 RepID=R0K7Q8_ANAPL|nr:hypothetical protein Anapl_01178 [Anas platyrhynchos]
MWVKQAGQECHFVGPFEWRQWSRLEAGAAALPLWAVLVPHSLCSHTCANKITPWCVISCIVTDMRSENKREERLKELEGAKGEAPWFPIPVGIGKTSQNIERADEEMMLASVLLICAKYFELKLSARSECCTESKKAEKNLKERAWRLPAKNSRSFTAGFELELHFLEQLSKLNKLDQPDFRPKPFFQEVVSRRMKNNADAQKTIPLCKKFLPKLVTEVYYTEKQLPTSAPMLPLGLADVQFFLSGLSAPKKAAACATVPCRDGAAGMEKRGWSRGDGAEGMPTAAFSPLPRALFCQGFRKEAGQLGKPHRRMAVYFHSSDSEIISGYERCSQQRNFHPLALLNLREGCRAPRDGHGSPQLSVPAQQIFFRHITAAVSAVGSEDCFGCVLGGWVCLLAWGQCGEGRGNGLIRMRRDKKWWDWKGEAAALVMERWAALQEEVFPLGNTTGFMAGALCERTPGKSLSVPDVCLTSSHRFSRAALFRSTLLYNENNSFIVTTSIISCVRIVFPGTPFTGIVYLCSLKTNACSRCIASPLRGNPKGSGSAKQSHMLKSCFICTAHKYKPLYGRKSPVKLSHLQHAGRLELCEWAGSSSETRLLISRKAVRGRAAAAALSCSSSVLVSRCIVLVCNSRTGLQGFDPTGFKGLTAAPHRWEREQRAASCLHPSCVLEGATYGWGHATEGGGGGGRRREREEGEGERGGGRGGRRGGGGGGSLVKRAEERAG